MYYLRTKSAVDAIKFTVDNTVKKEKAVVAAASPQGSSAPAQQIEVEPLTPEELKEMIAKSQNSPDDDCLMCGS